MKNRLQISRTILFIICLSCVIIISNLTTIYGDDFTYGAYFLDGFSEFLRLSINHYNEVNGRAFVHFVLQCVLVFKDSLFFVVIPTLVCGAFISFYKSFLQDRKNSGLMSFLTLAISGTMFLSVLVWREGVLWMSGAVNYIFPLIFSYAVFGMIEKTDKGKSRWYYYLTAFLAGATTEQGGAMSMAAVVMYILYYSIINKKMMSAKVYILALTVLLGYLSIFLSPATLGRLFSETVESGESITDRLGNLFMMCFGEGGALWLFVITELALLAELIKRNRYFAMTGAVLLAVAAATVISGVRLFGGVMIVGLIMLTVAVMLFTRTSPRLAIAMIAAGAGLIMLVCATSFGYRNLIPVYFTMIAVSASVLTKYFSKKVYPLEIIISGVIVLSAAAVFLPVISGYAVNRRIINENLAAYQKEEIDYNLGIKYPHSYVQFFEISGIYEKDFRKIYNIPEEKNIRFFGDDFEDFTCNGKSCKPVFVRDGMRYYPMRDVLEANGWSVSYDVPVVKITHGDKLVEYNTLTAVFNADGNVYDAYALLGKEEDYRGYFRTYIYFRTELFEKVFGIKLQ